MNINSGSEYYLCHLRSGSVSALLGCTLLLMLLPPGSGSTLAYVVRRGRHKAIRSPQVGRGAVTDAHIQYVGPRRQGRRAAEVRRRRGTNTTEHDSAAVEVATSGSRPCTDRGSRSFQGSQSRPIRRRRRAGPGPRGPGIEDGAIAMSQRRAKGQRRKGVSLAVGRGHTTEEGLGALAIAAAFAAAIALAHVSRL